MQINNPTHFDRERSSKASMMRILIADDHDLVRDTIAVFLEREGIHEVVKVEDLHAALKAVKETGFFDLVLLDYKMPGMNGLDGLKKMQATDGARKVALLSGDATPKIAKDAIAAGAAGFVPKTMGASSMASAIRFMVAGETFLPFDFMQQEEQDRKVGNLTERETEVLRYLCEGLANKEIARELDLQEATIKLHVKTLCRKLDAKNRTHAAMIARDRDLI